MNDNDYEYDTNENYDNGENNSDYPAPPESPERVPITSNTLALFRLFAVEFSGISDEEIKTWIELTESWISKRAFGKFYHEALAYLVAHRMKLHSEDKINLAGVSSYSEGRVSIGFGKSDEDGLPKTTYGGMFEQLRDMVVIPMVI